MEIDNTDIYNWMRHKFQNKTLPNLPIIITGYLIEHKEKLDLYLDKKIKIDKLLEFIASKYKANKNTNILEIVKKFVEDEN